MARPQPVKKCTKNIPVPYPYPIFSNQTPVPAPAGISDLKRQQETIWSYLIPIVSSLHPISSRSTRRCYKRLSTPGEGLTGAVSTSQPCSARWPTRWRLHLRQAEFGGHRPKAFNHGDLIWGSVKKCSKKQAAFDLTVLPKI